MTVGELIEQLKKCPQDTEIQLYYDGDARLVPNMAFLAPGYQYGCEPKHPLVVLGESDGIYNLDYTERWGGETEILFDVSDPDSDEELEQE